MWPATFISQNRLYHLQLSSDDGATQQLLKEREKIESRLGETQQSSLQLKLDYWAAFCPFYR
jgi:hypothetical protein